MTWAQTLSTAILTLSAAIALFSWLFRTLLKAEFGEFERHLSDTYMRSEEADERFGRIERIQERQIIEVQEKISRIEKQIQGLAESWNEHQCRSCIYRPNE